MALYKYTSTRLLPHLAQCTLRFSPQSKFNDPFDSVPDTEALTRNPAYQRLIAPFAAAAAAKSKRSSKAAAGAKVALEIIASVAKPKYVARNVADLENFRILCLSKAPPDSSGAALMWGHYALDVVDNKPHAGLALEFDETNPWFAAHLGRIDRFYEPVEYRTTRPSLSSDGRRVFVIKSKLWEYEQEIRLVRFIGKNANDLTGPDKSDANYPPGMLTAVYVGIFANPTLTVRVKAELAKNPALAHVKVHKITAIAPDHFRFESTA